MNRADKRDIVILGACLLGVAAGSILDERRGEDKPAAQSGQADLQPVISLPALMTASTLSRKIGESAGVEEQNIAKQAFVAFLTGLALTYFADFVRKFMPGLR